MFKVFNKRRSTSLQIGKAGRYLSYAVGEIILVVVGILIALQVNTWKEGRKNRDTERKYLEALLEDIHLDLEHNEGVVNNSTHNLTAMNNVREAIRSKALFEELEFGTFPLSSQNDTIKFITSMGRMGFMILHQY